MNVIGTSTCIIGVSQKQALVPGVCGVVPGSVLPGYTGIEAGLSAVGDLFDGIARRAGIGCRHADGGSGKRIRAGQTGLLAHGMGQRRSDSAGESQSRRRHTGLELNEHRSG